jgi:hypothetical protein
VILGDGRGPPNRPTRDRMGLLPACLTFLAEKKQCVGSQILRRQQQMGVDI